MLHISSLVRMDRGVTTEVDRGLSQAHTRVPQPSGLSCKGGAQESETDEDASRDSLRTTSHVETR